MLIGYHTVIIINHPGVPSSETYNRNMQVQTIDENIDIMRHQTNINICVTM